MHYDRFFDALMKKAVLDYLEGTGSWVAARAIARRFLRVALDEPVKFLTCQKHEGKWIAVQWVTTTSSPFDLAPPVYPGRVGISRRRQRAMRKMWNAKWIGNNEEPTGVTLGIQIYVRRGK